MRAAVRREEPDQDDPNYRRAVLDAARAQNYAEYLEERREHRNLLIMKLAVGVAAIIALVILLFG